MNTSPLNLDEAQTIALSGLQYLANDDDLLMRFSNLTGLLPNDMREAASEPHFLAGILDFFLSHEPDLLAWSEAMGHNPEYIARARHTLSPQDQSGFE